MASKSIDTKGSQNDNQVTVDRLNDSWHELKDKIYSLDLYPHFEETAKIYLKYKVHQNEQTDPHTLDELIYLLEMIEFTIEDLITIIKTGCKNFITSETIKGVLKDKFSLFEIGIIDQNIIEELTNLLLHLKDQEQQDAHKIEVQDKTVIYIGTKGNIKTNMTKN